MTIPQNVEDALSLIDLDDGSCLELCAVSTIRAYLMSLETELADYKNASMHRVMSKFSQNAVYALEIMESRWSGYATAKDIIRIEIRRLSEIAAGVEPLVVRLHEVTERLRVADGLLRQCFVYSPEFVMDEASKWLLQHHIQTHLRAGDTEAK